MKVRQLAIPFGVVILLATILIANRHIFLATTSSTTTPSRAMPLPPRFPSNFPVYPGAVYLGAHEAVGQARGRSYDRGWFAVLEEGRTVVRWYRAQLPQHGYAPIDENEARTGGRFNFGGDKEVFQMEIFVSRDAPTIISVDFYSTP